MKKPSLAFISVFALQLICNSAKALDSVVYPAGQNTPDIVIQSIFHKEAQDILVNELRQLMKVHAGFDPLNYSFDAPVELKGELNTKMEPLAQQMVNGLLKADLTKSSINVKMEGLRYEVKGAKITFSDLTPCVAPEQGVDFNLHVKFDDTTIKADSLTLTFNSPSGKKKSPFDNLWVSMKNPSVYSPSLTSLEVDLKMNLLRGADGRIHPSLKESSFKTFETLTVDKLKDEIQLSFGDVALPEIEIEVGGGRMPIRHEGIAQALQIRKNAIAELMLKPLVNLLKSAPEKIANSKIQKAVVDTAYPVSIAGRDGYIDFNSIAQIGENQLRLAFDFIEKNASVSLNALKADEDKNFMASMDHIAKEIGDRRSDIIVSLSDDVISRVAQPLIEKELKKDPKSAIALGPKKVFTVMDSHENGVAVVDLVVDVKKLGRIVLGKRFIRVPVVLYPKLKTGLIAGKMPTLEFEVSEADLSNKTLRYGDYDVRSDIQDIRFKRFVMKKIRSEVTKLLAKTKISLPITPLKGLELDFINFESDGHGRFNMKAALDPADSQNIRDFWNMLPVIISQNMKTTKP